jgi:RNA polymerase-binding transcription factor DksA
VPGFPGCRKDFIMSNQPPTSESVRARLMARRDELRQRVRRIDADLQHGAVQLSADFADRASETGNEPVLEQIGLSAQDELAQIDAALHRLDSGQYLRCTVCHGQIEAARIEAVPYAVTCRRCA